MVYLGHGERPVKEAHRMVSDDESIPVFEHLNF